MSVDPPRFRGKAEANGSVRANKFHPTCRGIGDGMYAMGTMHNTGSPSGDRVMDQLATRERQASPFGMAERLVVLMKLVNSGEWKGWVKKTRNRHAVQKMRWTLRSRLVGEAPARFIGAILFSSSPPFFGQQG
jgi:hypothetical protein